MSTQANTSNKSVFVGIDFGTTKTIVASYDPVKKSAKPLTFGRGKFEKPTSMYVTEKGELLFGDDADDEGITDMPNHIRRFKMKLGKPGLAHVGRKSGTALQLTSEFLSNLRWQMENQVLHTKVDRVVLTVPAMFGPAQRHDLTEAARLAGFAQVALLEEPVAAGMAYCDNQGDISKEIRFIVVDWGGGTFDVAHVERSLSGEIKVHEDFVVGLDDIGGEAFDDELWEIASNALDSAGYGSLNNQSRENWGRYRRDLSRAKEILSTKSSVSMTFTLSDGKTAKISLEREDFNKIIMPMIQKAASFLSGLIVRAHNAGYPPEFILLAGGTSRIPLIGQELERITGVKCRQWSDGREAIALGAAIKSHLLWGKDTEKKMQAYDEDALWKEAAIAQYRNLLEGAWIDKLITHEERIFIGKKRKELGLTIEESEKIQIQILGARIAEITKEQNCSNQTNARKDYSFASDSDSRALAKQLPMIVRIDRSLIGLQVVALAPEAHPDLSSDDLILRTHFPLAYLVVLENLSDNDIDSVRLSIESSSGHKHSLLIPQIKPKKSGILSLSSADLDGWMITAGDKLTFDSVGSNPIFFEVSDDLCMSIDKKKSLHEDMPCVVTVRKATFSSNFVLKIFNIQNIKIKITEFRSPAGIISMPIEIEPNSYTEIGWCELSEGRNLASGEEFIMSIQGYRMVQGVIAEGQIKGSSGIWATLGAIGGIALAAAGG